MTAAPERGRVLVVDDDRAMCDLLEARLGRAGFEVATRTSADEALRLLDVDDFDVVVTDVAMAGMNGIALCERLAANRPDVPAIVITAFGSLDTAVAAIRAGAYDFIAKPLDADVLALALDRAVKHRALGRELTRLKRAVLQRGAPGDIIGASGPMRALFDLVDRAAATESSVLVTGETGTGKEIVARALHDRSRRAGGPFVAVSCAAIPETLLESELFGHVPGAFTDARRARAGLLAQAAGGTLFLDEVGDMPLALQAKVLRALQERAVRPVGGEAEVPVDVRIVAATHRDLETAVEEGAFRADLLYRLDVIHIEVPPLRARPGDILLLAQRFLERFAAAAGKGVTGITPAAAERLVSYAWPGNVRELQNAIERAVGLTRFEQLTVDDLPEKVHQYRRSDVIVAGIDPSELAPLDEVERRYIGRVLEAAGGNKTLAARILGIDKTTLYRKLERYRARASGRDGEAP